LALGMVMLLTLTGASLLTAAAQPVGAEDIGGGSVVSGEDVPRGPGIPDLTPGDMLSGLMALPIRGLARALTWAGGAFKFRDISELVFGQPDRPETMEVVTSEEWTKVVQPWYRRMFYVATAPSVIGTVVLVSGYAVALSTANPRSLANVTGRFWDIACAAMLVGAGPTIVKLLSDLNVALVNMVRYGLEAQGIDLAGLTMGRLINQASTGSALLDAMIELAFAGVMLQINLIYLVRKFVVCVLLILMPLVAWAWAFRGTRTPVLIALSEIATNSLMNFSHALVLGFYLTLLKYDGTGIFNTWWGKLFGVTLIIPVSALLRRMIAGWLNFLGIDEERWAGLAAAGFGGIVAIGAAAGTALGATGSTVARSIANYRALPTSGPGGGGGGGGPAGSGETTLTAGADASESDKDLPKTPSEVGNMYVEPPARRPWFDWDGAVVAAQSVGRFAGTLAGTAVGGHRGYSGRGYAELGAMVFGAPVSAGRKVADVITAARPKSLDETRWKK